MSKMRKLLVLSMIGLSVLVVLDHAQADKHLRSQSPDIALLEPARDCAHSAQSTTGASGGTDQLSGFFVGKIDGRDRVHENFCARAELRREDATVAGKCDLV